ncbi:CDP-alcohol phosphatidyltransferase family protein [Aurantimonas sp. VKM B-3413]|uniref:CDP-alcohol phosphatidyltransferase family protein n=1 Tax=Aurantimonas sp. VKM B-3413 TaxID=2779401 RepID=UPI00351D9C50
MDAAPTPPPQDAARRPLKSRRTGWAARLLALLLKTPLSANQISFAGILFSAGGAAAMIAAPGHPWLWLVAGLAIQLRLLANMMDGLVAVEGGRGAPTGSLWNEAPDRIEDSLFLVAMGYAAGFGWLGWLAALLAVLTAYVRLLGVSVGLPHDFRGPMAKPHRMAVLTLACILAAAEGWIRGSAFLPAIALAVVASGTAVTVVRRLARQAEGLRRPVSLGGADRPLP